MKIITVTLNPVFDVFFDLDGFALHKENHVDNIYRCLGGKGLNVSRVLKANGTDSIAFVLLGNENGSKVETDLKAEGINYRAFYTEGRVRENYTVRSDGKETRICTNTFASSASDLETVLIGIKNSADSDAVIICSGKFPNGISRNDAVSFLLELKKISRYVVLDSNYFTSEEIIGISPWMIKPNEEEILIFATEKNENSILIADRVHSLGIRNVLLSLGSDGAYYCGELGNFRIKVPKITPISTIGAGDSTLAGFVKGYTEGKEPDEILRFACAMGTAACLKDGTTPPSSEEISKILKSIFLKRK